MIDSSSSFSPPTAPPSFSSSYGAHVAGLSADTVYTVTVYDPSATIATTWSTSSSDAAIHYLEFKFSPTLLPTPLLSLIHI